MELKATRLFQITLIVLITNQYCNSFSLPDLTQSLSDSGGPPQSTSLEKRLCPEGEAFDNGTATCHKLLEKGPCGDLQLFYLVSTDSDYGACACMSNEDGCNQLVKSNRMILPSSDGKKCFWAYSTGPCPDGQWYVLNMKSLKPECQKNQCYSEDGRKKSAPIKGADEVVLGIGQGGDDKFTFVLNGTCYDTYTKAYCPEGQYVQFLGTNNPYPKCFKVTTGPPFCMFGAAPVAGMPCEAGFKRIGEDCVMANIGFD